MNSSQDAISGTLTIPPENEAYWVENLVREQLLKAWEAQDEPEHLRTIRNRILSNQDIAGRLLGIYQQILQAEAGSETEKTENLKKNYLQNSAQLRQKPFINQTQLSTLKPSLLLMIALSKPNLFSQDW